MKKYILILFLFLSGSVFSQTYLDSIPTVDDFGRVRNGIIVDGIVSVLNTDPSGVKLTEPELAYIRSIVGGMYLAGSWQKCKALYGFVGGNAWKHKWNWKDMRDLDVAFRLTTVGSGIIHSKLGVRTTNSASRLVTNLIPLSELTYNDTHLSLFSQSTITNQGSEIEVSGSNSSGGSPFFRLGSGYLTNLGISFAYNPVNGIVTIINKNNGKGFIVASKTPNNHRVLQDGIISVSFANTGTADTNKLPDLPMVIFPNDYYSPKTISLVSIGSALTDQQAIQTSHVVTFAQGVLNR